MPYPEHLEHMTGDLVEFNGQTTQGFSEDERTPRSALSFTLRPFEDSRRTTESSSLRLFAPHAHAVGGLTNASTFIRNSRPQPSWSRSCGQGDDSARVV